MKTWYAWVEDKKGMGKQLRTQAGSMDGASQISGRRFRQPAALSRYKTTRSEVANERGKT